MSGQPIINGLEDAVRLTKLFEKRGAGEFCGMKVVIDPTMPNDTVEFQDDRGRVLGRITNIG